MTSALPGYEAQVNIHIQHRLVAFATVLSLGAMGCGSSSDQPADPSNSTLQQPSISDVPEGNMVPPLQPAEPGTSESPGAPGTNMGG